MADFFHHLAHLMLAALVYDDAQPGARAFLAQNRHLGRAGAATSDQEAATAQPVKRGWWRFAVNKGVILLVQPVARMHDAVGQFAIVGQQ
jgi:hypothetical protein